MTIKGLAHAALASQGDIYSSAMMFGVIEAYD
jgi:hypothetical protein